MEKNLGMRRASLMVRVAVMATVLLCGCGAMGEKVKGGKSSSSKALPGKAVEGVMKALQEAGGYTTAALLLPYLEPILQKRTTLLIPSDEAIRRGLPTWRPPQGIVPTAAMSGGDGGRPPFSFLSSQQLRSVAKLHIIKSANLSFADLLKLPSGTLLPTLLGPGPQVYLHILQRKSHDLVINNAHIHHPDLCPPSLAPFLTCHGITSLLSPLSSNSSSHPPPLHSSYPFPPPLPYSSYTPSIPPPPSYPSSYSPPYPSPYPTNYSNSSPPTYPSPSPHNYSSPYPTYSNFSSSSPTYPTYSNSSSSSPSYPTTSFPNYSYSSPYPTSYNTSSPYPPLTLPLPPLVDPSNTSSPLDSPSSNNETSQPSPSPSPTPSFVPTSQASHSKLTTMSFPLLFIPLLAL
ncbi:hypothetical protein GOP47_0004656 [Adiantum capillus-veneris]|uniref:FAS1 domain-containing protein n=1 Tax=Adiantum capillus-veneris TaxID=13818 RepID=A0A9D4ZMU4_ADICA|nr:hypothetical protein GOP47_0004656 [Adiantum capillus-veneris]